MAKKLRTHFQCTLFNNNANGYNEAHDLNSTKI